MAEELTNTKTTEKSIIKNNLRFKIDEKTVDGRAVENFTWFVETITYKQVEAKVKDYKDHKAALAAYKKEID